jgi:hypothetical protein
MSRPGGFQNDEVVRGAGVHMAKGIGLIAVAVIIGIVLLQIVDDGKTDLPAAAKPTTTTTAPTTQTTKKPTTTTKKPTTPIKQPSQVRVVVLNAGAQPGSARNMSQALKTKGYTNQPNQPTDWSAKRKGNAVLCRSGFQREAGALALAVGAGTQTAAFPSTPPPSSANVDCVVVVGG